ncbi:MAG TPA: type II secretion system protein F [Lachnospiraceae bacterium]|nr:type II secretion system protein F [Lachnospiraceae bacterium]
MTINLKQQVWVYKQNKRKFFLSEKRGIPIYSTYFFNMQERCTYLILSIFVTLFLCEFFYRSLWASIFLCPIGVYVYQSNQINKKVKRIQKLETEFKDCILSVSANLRAGYSVENAFLESVKDMLILYGKDSLITKELRHIQKGISNNMPMESILQEFGERSTNVKIEEFGEVFCIARKSGGNLPEIIQSTVQVISEEITIKQDIQVMISGRVLEQKIMNVIPFVLVLYIELANPGFFEVLYYNITGCVVMTVCLAVYVSAYLLSIKICV